MNPLLLVANRNWRWLVTFGLIVASTLELSVLSHGSPVALRKPFSEFPQVLGPWTGMDVPIDGRVQEVLQATDLLNRVYSNQQDKTSLNLFIGFFSSQRKGGSVHSPKNCLPGDGWWVSRADVIPIGISGRSQPLVVNQYVIQKDLSEDIVLYWYQSQGRVIASEYTAKFFLIWDALKKNRTDGALVRVVVPVRSANEPTALAQAVSFVQTAYPQLTGYIPN